MGDAPPPSPPPSGFSFTTDAGSSKTSSFCSNPSPKSLSFPSSSKRASGPVVCSICNLDPSDNPATAGDFLHAPASCKHVFCHACINILTDPKSTLVNVLPECHECHDFLTGALDMREEGRELIEYHEIMRLAALTRMERELMNTEAVEGVKRVVDGADMERQESAGAREENIARMELERAQASDLVERGEIEETRAYDLKDENYIESRLAGTHHLDNVGAAFMVSHHGIDESDMDTPLASDTGEKENRQDSGAGAGVEMD